MSVCKVLPLHINKSVACVREGETKKRDYNLLLCFSFQVDFRLVCVPRREVGAQCWPPHLSVFTQIMTKHSALNHTLPLTETVSDLLPPAPVPLFLMISQCCETSRVFCMGRIRNMSPNPFWTIYILGPKGNLLSDSVVFPGELLTHH